MIGTTIADKYAIESLVGEGGFAAVYRAQHLIWRRPVAIKVFKALADVGHEQREKLLEDFIREGALLAELSEKSASICQARDVGTLTTPSGDVIPYMVLEWLEGAPLDDVLDDEKARGVAPRAIHEALRLLEPVAEALALAHCRGIAHRDIKPANIFLLGDPRGEHCPAKLLDFGIAKVVQDAQKAAGAFTKTIGELTSFTPAYGAPEQFSRHHGATGPWTDVFALTLVFVECLIGDRALDGNDFVQIGYASANKDRRPSPRAFGIFIDDTVEEVFLKALAVSPVERYRTAGEFWNALRGALRLEPNRAIAMASLTTVPVARPSGNSLVARVVSPLRVRQASSPTALTEPALDSSDPPEAMRTLASPSTPVPIVASLPRPSPRPPALQPPSASEVAPEPPHAAPPILDRRRFWAIVVAAAVIVGVMMFVVGRLL